LSQQLPALDWSRRFAHHLTAMTEKKTHTVLVTGAGRRIGRAIALGLGRDGHAIAVHYHTSSDEAEAVTEEIILAGGRAVALKADFTAEEQVKKLISAAADALGPVDCLINNASVFGNDGVDNATRETWDAHMETNLRAPFVLTQSLAAALPTNASGNVINILDARVRNLTPYFISYTLSKAGLWALTQTLALALAPRIRVNAVGPGPVLPSPRQTQAQFDRQASMMPLGQGSTPDEICDAVRFILAAPAMTGQMIALDGGQHLGWAQPGRDGGDAEE
jgi:NAD(P)-dependent dehydrogenase (short-subunit alcohol dehydrogenase family)